MTGPRDAGHRKVAILGTESSSLSQMPIGDEDWEIWFCAQMYNILPRWDVCFELHSLEYLARRGDRNEHIKWLLSQHDREKVIYCRERDRERIPNGVDYPKEMILDAFPSGYFTNTVSWMVALAIHQQVDEIGVWGVDMSLDEEYDYQRPSLEYFIGLARGKGIPVHIPSESCLLKTQFLYGFDDDSDLLRKADARQNMHKMEKQRLDQQIEELEYKRAKAEGASEAFGYFKRNWAHVGNGDDADTLVGAN